MKILMGICGIGWGHSLRQSVVVEWLIRRGHQLHVFCCGDSHDFFRMAYPHVPRSVVVVPWVACSRDGIDFRATASAEENMHAGGIGHNYRAMDDAQQSLGGPPDLVISDYEPTAAQFAYATGAPLVTLDQQSRFLGYNTPAIKGMSRHEEAARLRLFFPQASMRMATSVVPFEYGADTTYSVRLVPPLLRPALLEPAPEIVGQKSNSGSVLCYLPASGCLRQSPMAIIRELVSVATDVRFIVYSRAFSPEMATANVSVRRIGDGRFLGDLREAVAIIASAGHQIISEAVALCKPMQILPLNMYEQQFNASSVVANRFGDAVEWVESRSIDSFLARRAEHTAALNAFLSEKQWTDGHKIVFEELAQHYGV